MFDLRDGVGDVRKFAGGEIKRVVAVEQSTNSSSSTIKRNKRLLITDHQRR